MADTFDALAGEVLRKYQGMCTSRMTYERNWQDIRLLVRPNTEDFNRMSTPGDVRTLGIYDGTALDALVELASGLHSYLTNPTDRWFTLEVDGYSRDVMTWRDPEALAWLDQVSDILYEEYSHPDSKFSTSIHECYLDLGAFGTAAVCQEWNRDSGHLQFRSIPMANAHFLENSDEVVDTVAITHMWSLRQVQQEFPSLPERIAKMCREVKDQERPVKVVNMVMPRRDRRPQLSDQRNMPWASVWVCVDTKEVLKESGYQSFPYHCPRWVKLAGEVYGRGPAMTCLPDIRMLNRMEFTLIKAGQKAVDPPLVVPDDGFVLPLQTHPGAMIYKESGADDIVALEHKGNLPFGMEQSDQKRQFIQKCFYSDWLKMGKEKVEMTAYETQDRRDEKLRMMAPMLGRQESELLGPLISRSYFLLNEQGRIPQSPRALQRRNLKVAYCSPASKAQTGVKAISMGRYLQGLIPLAQVDPTVMDVIDTDKYSEELAKALGTPRAILRSPEQVAEIRKKREGQQQAAAMAQLAEPASKAIKNLADAQKAGAT